MALQLVYDLGISITPQEIYCKILQANTVAGKRPIYDENGNETSELEEYTETNMRLEFYNSIDARQANKKVIKQKSISFENEAISDLTTAYLLLKTHNDFNEAVDV